MEVIGYEAPTGWDDRGMDWSSPDPRNADYAVAIRQALAERFSAAHAYLPAEVAEISPWKTASLRQMAACVSAVAQIAPHYVNREWRDYADDLSDFPRAWTYRELAQEEGCRLYDFARPGDLCEGSGAWLRAMRTAIDRLTLVKCRGLGGVSYRRSGARHDPPFDESIGGAMELALGRSSVTGRIDDVPTEIYAWSGNTHWKCKKPGEEESEDNRDGYCGYAESLAYRITRVRNWAVGREFDLVAYVLVSEPTGPAPYSEELATSAFDPGASGYRRGMNEIRVHVSDPLGVGLDLGSEGTIPQNTTVPSSEFDGDGNLTHGRSAKRGFVGKMWFLQDYACEGGFGFRKTEEG